MNNIVKPEFVSKFMCQNRIVLYHVRLEGNKNGFVSSDFLEKMLSSFNIDLPNRSSIKRINVKEHQSGGYCLRKDSNSSEVLNYYGSNVYKDSGAEFEKMLVGVVAEVLRREHSQKRYF